MNFELKNITTTNNNNNNNNKKQTKGLITLNESVQHQNQTPILATTRLPSNNKYESNNQLKTYQTDVILANNNIYNQKNYMPTSNSTSLLMSSVGHLNNNNNQ